MVQATLHVLREDAGRGNGLTEQMKTFMATRIHKAHAALARIHGNRCIANGEYLKNVKDVTVAGKAIEEAMVMMGNLSGPDPERCKLIGKSVKAAMQLVEKLFVKMWEVRPGHCSLTVL